MADGLQQSMTITASSAAQGLAFVDPSATGIVLKANYVKVTNDGSSSAAYFDFTSTAASVSTTNGYALKTTESISITCPEGHYLTGLSYVSSSAAAPSCRVLALRV